MANIIRKAERTATRVWIYITRDIWRVYVSEGEQRRFGLDNIIRILYLAGRGFMDNKLSLTASALTYFTLLAFVPFLSLILGIAKGFDAQEYLQAELINQFPGQSEVLNLAFGLVDSVLSYASKGIVVGLGIVFIIWSLWSIVSNIENSFNRIWQISKGRSFSRRITDLLATIFVLPIILILTFGVTIYLKTAINTSPILSALSPVMNVLVKCIPYFLSFIIFTVMYIIIPNTKVKLPNALLGGLLAGIAFQAFQYLYINGQLWVNRYNAIYGSFAALPLLLLWLQLTWTIVLFGAEITFAAQNIRNFLFEKESRNISQRYRYFFTILIMNVVCKRFDQGLRALSDDELSSQYHIPIGIVKRQLDLLCDVGLLSEANSSTDDRIRVYQPAMDIHQISVSLIWRKIFEHGTEDFKMNPDERYPSQWRTLLDMENALMTKGEDILAKDL
ncbi:MAG: YihY/virulence factor BrkB family protein [Bacteroidales bacterium]|nr:YihY/virulence factor BrkB family protein [Bacteroidales bacterium]